MKTINETDLLKETIQLLRIKQANELVHLKDQYYYTYESLKPLNLIKNAFGQMATSSDFKGNILGNVIGISTGYLTKKILLGSTHNPVKRILGTLLQFVITNVVTKHSDTSKS
ncbi:hypothetical protein E0I26_08660 [Flavobacterium rhamnosiphilum]|jgi:hypothetical protein|uniref:Uncharacterized protein n=1 Tax=Flavobacterium rhamnosiphilum TaxID=2541724 RepID=A0A4V2Z9C4_9FLAO|nr:hypothetical protein [Flavobacterium rhamnosiphilum]TDE44428.1 hypothetical protein E0I26_08660 [Flavobacterium rhamnosiphilum]